MNFFENFKLKFISTHLGTSCLASTSNSMRSLESERLVSLKKEVATPRLPMRPVRPMRCTYSSTSEGRSKLIT